MVQEYDTVSKNYEGPVRQIQGLVTYGGRPRGGITGITQHKRDPIWAGATDEMERYDSYEITLQKNAVPHPGTTAPRIHQSPCSAKRGWRIYANQSGLCPTYDHRPAPLPTAASPTDILKVLIMKHSPLFWPGSGFAGLQFNQPHSRILPFQLKENDAISATAGSIRNAPHASLTLADRAYNADAVNASWTTRSASSLKPILPLPWRTHTSYTLSPLSLVVLACRPQSDHRAIVPKPVTEHLKKSMS